jgi:hypothetical protein
MNRARHKAGRIAERGNQGGRPWNRMVKQKPRQKSDCRERRVREKGVERFLLNHRLLSISIKHASDRHMGVVSFA